MSRLLTVSGRDALRDAHSRHGLEALVLEARRAQGAEVKSALPHWRHQRVLEDQERRNRQIREQRKDSDVVVQAFSTSVSGGDEAA